MIHSKPKSKETAPEGAENTSELSMSAPAGAAPAFQAPKKKRKWPRRVIIIAVILVALFLALRSCGKNAVQSLSGMYLPSTVQKQNLSVTVTGTGTVKPNDDYRATTLLRGEILTAPFEEGDLVTKDQVLFTLDPTDAENNIRSAESGVERARLSLEQAQLAYDNLLKTQKDNAEDMAIEANATGVIAKLYIKQGDTVGAGTPIADILDRDTMELTVPFHRAVAQNLTVGQSAVVTVTGTATPLTGTVSEVGFVDSVIAGGAVVRQITIRVANPGTLDAASTATAQIGDAACASAGTFAYAEAKQVVAMASGKVERLSVKEGDRVQNGQKLGSFELPDLQSQIDNASVSVRSAQLALSDAEEGLRIARDVLDDYTISSPITGTVIEKNYKAGDNVDPTAASTGGGYMAVIYDLSRLTFDMNVSELDVSRVKVGQSVTFTSDALEGQTFTGHVDKININGTTLNGSTNYPVTIVVDNGEGLYPGMNVSANILVEEVGEVLAVPVEAVQRGNTVLVAPAEALNKDGELADISKLEERAVELGRGNSEYIEIVSGVSEGETVCIPNMASNAMAQMMGMMGG